MKICILSLDRDSIGIAAERIINKNALLMSRMGHDVTLILTRNRGVDEGLTSAVNVMYSPPWLSRLSCRGGFGLGDFVYRTKIILSGKFDIIHSMAGGHRPIQMFPAMVGRIFTNAKLIDEWWEWIGGEGIASTRLSGVQRVVGWYDTFFELRGKKPYHGVIAITSELKNRLSGKKNCLVLHGATERNLFEAYAVEEAREAVHLDLSDFIIGMSNLSLDDHDDNYPFLCAMQKAMQENSKLKLLVTGPEGYIESVVKPMFPQEQVISLGWLSLEDYNRYLSACNAFALPLPPSPRNRGRWPNKIGDYICLQRPVITNPTGDVKVLLENYPVGLLVRADSESYLQAIWEVDNLKSSVDVFQSALENIPDFDSRVRRILKFYEEVL